MSTRFAPADVKPSKAETRKRKGRNACDSPGLYEVNVLYFAIFRPLRTISLPLVLVLKLLLVLRALVALLSETDDFVGRPFSAQ